MTKKVFSTNLFRILLIAALVIPLALGATSPAEATTTYTVTGWGYNEYGQIDAPPSLTDVIAIAAGTQFSLALKSDGTVVGWGRNDLGQINIPPDLTNVVAIAAGQKHGIALKDDGTVVAWGWNGFGQTIVPSDLTDVVAISAGAWHNLALKSDGTVVAWGHNYYQQLDIPIGLTDVVAISGGAFVSLALKNDGTVVGWGWNGWGVITIPPDLTDVVAISAGSYHTMALKSDGTVVAWGCGESSTNLGQCTVPSGLGGVTAISAGVLHSLALKNDGTVVAWGGNEYGQRDIPSSLTGAITISAGDLHSLALAPADIPANTAPTATPGGPYLGAVNTAIQFDGTLSSDPENDPLTYAWDFGDGATGNGATPAHSYTAAGVYDLCLTVNDGALSSSPICTLAVVYDPSAGFVTGGGWIDSPVGAYKADEGLAGKATFGFMSKYQKGASAPTGNTAFQFDLAGMAFSSTSYEWLVVNQAGTNAQFKGSGLINGTPDPNGNAYKFMLWAGNGSPDTFRIRIWWEDAAGEYDVYDNGTDQAIGAGNIVVHTGK